MVSGVVGSWNEYPVIVQPQGKILVRDGCARSRDAFVYVSRIARVVSQQEYVRSYSIDSLSVWTGRSLGFSGEQLVSDVDSFCRGGIPQYARERVLDISSKYGLFSLVKNGSCIDLNCDSEKLFSLAKRELSDIIDGRNSRLSIGVKPLYRSEVKLRLLKRGYPVRDLAGYAQGKFLDVNLRSVARSGASFSLHPDQLEDVDLFLNSQGDSGGSWTICEPCGGGKTIIALAIICGLKTYSLVLVPRSEDVEQWYREILDKTDIDPSLVGRFTADEKNIKPLTVATYSSATYRDRVTKKFTNLGLFSALPWGLVCPDECQRFPAEVSIASALIPGARRLGLSGSLVREDKRVEYVFSLIGPTLVNRPWRDAERKGRIAKILCNQINVSVPESLEERLAESGSLKIASCNPNKVYVVVQILNYFSGANDRRIIIGHKIPLLRSIAERLNLPLLYGGTPIPVRNEVYSMFNSGEIDTMVISSIGSTGRDWPSTNVIIEVSGNGRSRQEEGQVTGRGSRDLIGGKVCHHFILASAGTREEYIVERRKQFLREHGYTYCVGNSLEEILSVRGLSSLNGGVWVAKMSRSEILRVVDDRIAEKLSNRVRSRSGLLDNNISSDGEISDDDADVEDYDEEFVPDESDLLAIEAGDNDNSSDDFDSDDCDDDIIEHAGLYDVDDDDSSGGDEIEDFRRNFWKNHREDFE
ncbi:helicase-associated domain-containing protein [Candidatus Woesearchaeota archaeon]|nr:helicase-associated domain-containing protein [Candidatus Woesearchaeota archaeon]